MVGFTKMRCGHPSIANLQEESKGSNEATEEEVNQKKASAILRHTLLNNAVRDLTIQAEVQAFQSLFLGDQHQRAVEAVKLMGKIQSLVGLGEFLLNPVVGRLSDAHGRKIFTMLGCAWATFGNLLVAQNPSARIGGLPVVALNRLINNTLLTISGSVTSVVALSDISSGSALAMNLGSMGAMFGLGSIVGPYAGAKILSRTNSVSACYRARAMLAAAQLLHNFFTIQETLTVANRRSFTLKGLNPFGFLKLLASRGPLRRLVMAQTLISMSEAKNVIDLKVMWLKQNLKFSIESVSNEQTIYSVINFVSNKFFAPAVMKNFGERLFTSLSLWMSATGFLLWGVAPKGAASKAVWLGLLLQTLNINASGSNAIKAKAVSHAVAQGLGKGEFGSYMANLRALTVLASPVIYSNLYAYFMTKHGGKGSRAWIAVAIISSVLPELLHRSLSDDKYKPPAVANATQGVPPALLTSQPLSSFQSPGKQATIKEGKPLGENNDEMGA